MRKISTLAMVFLCLGSFSHAQFGLDKLQFRLGYNIHNARAKNVNHLISAFNESRYPLQIRENLPSVNFLHGMVLGGTYAFSEDLLFNVVLKSDRQFIETQYIGSDMYRSFLFRQHSLELGLSMPISTEGRFQHLAGGGLLLGVMGAYTNWSAEQGYPGGRNMLNIDRSELIGLSLHYEAQFELLENVRLFVRPTAQFALNSHLRKMSLFFNPVLQDDGILYLEGEGEKYDKANLNGIGIEGGLLILLPQF